MTNAALLAILMFSGATATTAGQSDQPRGIPQATAPVRQDQQGATSASTTSHAEGLGKGRQSLAGAECCQAALAGRTGWGGPLLSEDCLLPRGAFGLGKWWFYRSAPHASAPHAEYYYRPYDYRRSLDYPWQMGSPAPACHLCP